MIASGESPVIVVTCPVGHAMIRPRGPRRSYVARSVAASTPEMEFDGVIFDGEPPVMLEAVSLPTE